MTLRSLIRIQMAGFLAAVAILAVGCNRAPKPLIADFDTYQTVRMGPVHYVTPAGMTTAETGRGRAVHKAAHLPGSTFQVILDPNPPRDFKFDADAERRRFLNELRHALSRSVQYGEIAGQQRLKVFVDAEKRDGTRLHGVLIVLREQGKTATIQALGPREDRLEINRLAEHLAEELKIDPLTPEQERGLIAAKRERDL